MKEEFLNQAANDYCHVNLYDGKYCRQDVYEAFQDGMKHTMELPLADRLSESEKEKIREIYNNLDYEDKGSWSMEEIAEYAMQNQRKRKILESIFGKTLFNPIEQ